MRAAAVIAQVIAARVFAAVALLGAASCGFIGDDQLTAREPADVTRFATADDRIVEICENGARLGPIAAAPLGWCGFAPSSATACDEDTDCRSRERCVCGACVVAACDSNDECGPGRICDFNDSRCDRACTTDRDCASGEQCVPGRNVCRGRCARDADCQSGESCDRDRGRCRTELCADDSACGGLPCGRVRKPAELREPSVVALPDGSLQLWFEERRAGSSVIRVASGTDPVRFVVAGDVVDGAAPSAALAPDGSVDLVWERNAELVAARYANGQLGPLAPIPSAGSTLLSPSHLVAPDGSRLLVARRSSDGAIVSLDEAGPIVVLATAADLVAPPYVLACSALDSPFLERDGVLTRLWLTARAVESGPSLQFGMAVDTPENDSIALLVRADDGKPFAPYPYNPVWAGTESITMHPFERAPSTVVRDNVRWLYYERAGLDGTTAENLRVVHSP